MRRALLIAPLVLVASACTTPLPPLDFTIAEVGRVQRKNAEMVSLTVGFAPQSQQRTLETDASLPPIWKEALQDTISRSLVFTDDAPMRVNISVRIVEMDVQNIGLDMTTKTAAIYEIVDRSNGDIILTLEIATKGLTPANYAFVGLVRARESVNRAVRNNIAEFMTVLESTDFSKPAFPTPTAAPAT